jgi:hypothetical protein
MPAPKRKLLPEDRGLRESLPLAGGTVEANAKENKMTIYLYEKDRRLLDELQTRLRPMHGYVSRSHIIRWALRHASFEAFEKI